jgi:hypothetical protein
MRMGHAPFLAQFARREVAKQEPACESTLLTLVQGEADDPDLVRNQSSRDFMQLTTLITKQHGDPDDPDLIRMTPREAI